VIKCWVCENAKDVGTTFVEEKRLAFWKRELRRRRLCKKDRKLLKQILQEIEAVNQGV